MQWNSKGLSALEGNLDLKEDLMGEILWEYCFAAVGRKENDDLPREIFVSNDTG